MTTQPTPSSHLLVRAARGEAVERPPVWAMRQAGRWDPEFARVRANQSFYELSEDVERAAEATLLPRRFGVDGIILFYDITTLLVAMGQLFKLKPILGPVPDRPVRRLADVELLQAKPDPERFRHIRELLRTVKGKLKGELPRARYSQGRPSLSRPTASAPGRTCKRRGASSRSTRASGAGCSRK